MKYRATFLSEQRDKGGILIRMSGCNIPQVVPIGWDFPTTEQTAVAVGSVERYRKGGLPAIRIVFDMYGDSNQQRLLATKAAFQGVSLERDKEDDTIVTKSRLEAVVFDSESMETNADLEWLDDDGMWHDATKFTPGTFSAEAPHRWLP